LPVAEIQSGAPPSHPCLQCNAAVRLAEGEGCPPWRGRGESLQLGVTRRKERAAACIYILNWQTALRSPFLHKMDEALSRHPELWTAGIAVRSVVESPNLADQARRGAGQRRLQVSAIACMFLLDESRKCTCHAVLHVVQPAKATRHSPRPVSSPPPCIPSTHSGRKTPCWMLSCLDGQL